MKKQHRLNEVGVWASGATHGIATEMAASKLTMGVTT